MSRKGFSQRVVLIVILVLVVIGGVLYLILKRPIATQNTKSLSGTASSTSVTHPVVSSSTPSSGAGCATYFSDFGVPSLPTSTSAPTSTEYVWISSTPGNTYEFYELSSQSFSGTTEVIYPNAFTAEPASLNTALPGSEWVSPTGNLADLDDSYYGPRLQQEGWTHSSWVPIPGGGFQLNSEASGYIKVENGYFRSIVLSEIDGAPSYGTMVLVYESDIMPLSQIVPESQPVCPALAIPSATNSTVPTSTAWVASMQQVSPEVIVVPNSSSIPEVIKGKAVFLQAGDVWVANQDGSNPSQLTHTNGNVTTNIGDGNLIFAFSPDYHYLAYFVLSPGKSIASWEIDALDLSTNQVIQKINGNTLSQFSAFSQDFQYQTPRVAFEAWVANGQFIYNAWGDDGPGGGTDECGHLLVDLQSGTTTVIQPQ